MELIGFLDELGPDQNGSGASAALQAHINDLTPHPAYDDPIGLETYLENGLA